MSAPRLLVVAGPNGSGKSTLIQFLMKSGLDFGHYINADDIARERGLTGDGGAREAQAVADAEREECLRQRVDFSFETVMSHESKVDFMQRASAAGYTAALYFVATGDPLLNVERVRNRVTLGGHDVPEDRIVARYHRTLSLLPRAISATFRSFVFDNSTDGKAKGQQRGLRPILEAESGWTGSGVEQISMRLSRPFPEWATAALRLGDLGYDLKTCSHESYGAQAIFERQSSRKATAASDDAVIKTIRAAIETPGLVFART